jgi:hypothetical protein
MHAAEAAASTPAADALAIIPKRPKATIAIARLIFIRSPRTRGP